MAATAPASLAPAPTARIDGYAVAAADSYGASAYTPIRPQQGLVEMTAGALLPPGMNAVLPYGAIGEGEIVEAVAPSGSGRSPSPGLPRPGSRSSRYGDVRELRSRSPGRSGADPRRTRSVPCSTV